MSRYSKCLVAVALLAIVVYGSVRLMTAAPVPPPKDELRWVKIDNADIFDVMGVRAWRLHVPAEQLAGKTQFELRLSRDGGKPEPLATARLNPRRKEAESLDVTVILYFDSATPREARRLSVALTAPEFSWRSTHSNPLLGFDTYAQPNDLGDLTAGIDLCTLGIAKPDEKLGNAREVKFSLWLK